MRPLHVRINNTNVHLTEQVVISLVARHGAILGHILALGHRDVRPRNIASRSVSLMTEKSGDASHRQQHTVTVPETSTQVTKTIIYANVYEEGERQFA